jgi:hypothetical protein
MEEVLIPLGLFATIFGVVYLFLTTRNRERMALIEKGADAKMFNTGKSLGGGGIILSLALLAIGVGTGVLTGGILETMGMDDDVSYPASIFIFAGIGLLISFFLNRRLTQKDDYVS